MSAKASKEVIDRVRSGRHLLSAYEVEGPRVAASFVEETRDHLEEGDEEPRPDSVLVAVERKLRGSMDHLVGTDYAAKMLGKSRFEQPVDLAPYVAEIRKKSAALLALSDEINEAHRASDRARIARSRAKEVFDRVYLRSARIFEDLCRFAGLDDLAARVRRREGRATPPAETTQARESPPTPLSQSRGRLAVSSVE